MEERNRMIQYELGEYMLKCPTQGYLMAEPDHSDETAYYYYNKRKHSGDFCHHNNYMMRAARAPVLQL